MDVQTPGVFLNEWRNLFVQNPVEVRTNCFGTRDFNLCTLENNIKVQSWRLILIKVFSLWNIELLIKLVHLEEEAFLIKIILNFKHFCFLFFFLTLLKTFLAFGGLLFCWRLYLSFFVWTLGPYLNLFTFFGTHFFNLTILCYKRTKITRIFISQFVNIWKNKWIFGFLEPLNVLGNLSYRYSLVLSI